MNGRTQRRIPIPKIGDDVGGAQYGLSACRLGTEMSGDGSCSLDGHRGQGGTLVGVRQRDHGRKPLGDRNGQRRGVTLVEHGRGVDARHPAEVGDRIDDHVEVLAPIALGRDRDLRSPGPVHQNGRVRGVPVRDGLTAVDES